MLGALLDFVVAGEEKSEMDVDDEDVKGASCVRNTVMQKYLQRILDCAYSKSQEVAEAALKLVSHIYKGGQVCHARFHLSLLGHLSSLVSHRSLLRT